MRQIEKKQHKCSIYQKKCGNQTILLGKLKMNQLSFIIFQMQAQSETRKATTKARRYKKYNLEVYNSKQRQE